jgi:LmbE family N-acetylglucosaminyl deacetylase
MLTGMELAVLSPHFDDALLSCWRVLAGSDQSIVLNVFTGSPAVGTPAPWWDRMTGADDPVRRMRERRAEDSCALASLGRDAVQLGLLDDQYRDAELSVNEVTARIRDAVRPETTLYAPAALDGHPDHILVRDAALALARADWRVVMYADLPHAITRGWAEWVSPGGYAAGARISEEWDAALASAGLAVEELRPVAYSLDERDRAAKLLALAEYRTQRAALDQMAFAPLQDPRTLAWEVSWDVPASALRSPAELGAQTLVADSRGESRDDRS